MDKKQLFSLSYQLLNKIYPLKMDCGNLCNKACCKDTTENLGMFLFPGEEELLQPMSFLTIKEEILMDNQVLLAICNGACDRDWRPLACRIFPLTPYISTKDILKIRIDPRGISICPLVKHLERSELNPNFVKTVRKVCQLLIQDPEIKDYLVRLSRLLDEYLLLNDFLS